ncbi:MucR family transcriptional regulator [Sphingomonas endolithica]|uniref:MucR family transcriptional regulator n=1 Tax=Sphingomonas endolithica TaxID=2972485 RepID=UPI0021AEA5CC|nr:MucR family transcriptional regulator [Sphingomonas sp. ZFBP2030]
MENVIDPVTLAAELTIAWLSNSNTRAASEDVPAFLTSMHTAVKSLAAPEASVEPEAPAPEHKPAVTARKSLASPDYIISMIDGKPYRTLARHLAANGLRPAEYRQRYGLKPDYPMTAATYSEVRRAMAKKIGFGRKLGETNAARAAKDKAPGRRGRKPAAKKD